MAGLFGTWLILNESAAPGTIILGAAAAVLAGSALAALPPPRTKLRRIGVALSLMRDVFVEIVRSNNAVAQIILAPGAGERSSGFVRIPLDTRNPAALTALACIVTATPGTIWVEYDSAESTMLLHVLDLVDEEEWVRIIKDRYETRLMEIFS
nr:Na+/H+ antiporter subunit E [Enterovirga sp. DB1703]